MRGKPDAGEAMILAVLACGGIVLVAEPLTIALLRRLSVIDSPGERSSHSVPTPRGGGAPIAVGLIVAAALASSAGSAAIAAGPARRLWPRGVGVRCLGRVLRRARHA